MYFLVADLVAVGLALVAGVFVLNRDLRRASVVAVVAAVYGAVLWIVEVEAREDSGWCGSYTFGALAAFVAFRTLMSIADGTD